MCLFLRSVWGIFEANNYERAGCFAYDSTGLYPNIAFYGNQGTVQQRVQPLTYVSGIIRPAGFDCSFPTTMLQVNQQQTSSPPSSSCVPYSVEACRDAAVAAGLRVTGGWPFVGEIGRNE